jgi:hypothetical protein
MVWWQWLLAVYILVCGFQFLVAKLKDPMNPAGYTDPKLLQTIESFRSGGPRYKKQNQNENE